VSNIEPNKEVTLRGEKYLVTAIGHDTKGNLTHVHLADEPAWYSPAGFLNELNKGTRKPAAKKAAKKKRG